MRVHVVHPGLHMSSESRVVIKTKTHLALLPFEHRLREVRLSLAIGRGPSGQPVVQVVIEALLLPRAAFVSKSNTMASGTPWRPR